MRRGIITPLSLGFPPKQRRINLIGNLWEKIMIQLSAEYIRSRFDYDPELGLLCWKKANERWNKKPAGSLHKCNAGKVYIRVTLDRNSVYAHRIIWIWITGEQPDTIDHIDGNGLNNKWANLRSVKFSDNGKNQKKHLTNTSGYAGVSYRKDCGKWRARLMVDGKSISFGAFPTAEAAHKARHQAVNAYGFNSNHGKSLT